MTYGSRHVPGCCHNGIPNNLLSLLLCVHMFSYLHHRGPPSLSAPRRAEGFDPLIVIGMRHHHYTTKPYILTKFESEALESAVFCVHESSDHEQGDLFIRFTSGRTYFYPVVKTSTYVGLMFADSAGQYFNTHIRSLNSHEVTDNEQLVGALIDLVETTVKV